MEQREAEALIADAVAGGSGTWVDLGAGSGTFTSALRALLPPESRIYAIDSNPAAVAALRDIPGIIPIQADFTNVVVVPEEPLDGIVLANALHFVRDQEVVLCRLVERLRPGGRVVIVEYDRRAASQWVPYPVHPDRWLRLARSAGLEHPRITAQRPSQYAGELYAGVATRHGHCLRPEEALPSLGVGS
jgi:trans-aconitate methyltransferase